MPNRESTVVVAAFPTGVVVQLMDSMLPIRSFLFNSRLESFHLLNIEFRVDRLVSSK